MRKFNTTGLCIPRKHYMVSTDERVRQIRAMVDEGDYFCVNRGRQYGKTTTLFALEGALRDSYDVMSLDFQAISTAGYSTEGKFVAAFCRILWRKRAKLGIPTSVQDRVREIAQTGGGEAELDQLFLLLSDWCEESERPLVLIIDEVDSAANNQVFLDFLAQLRLQYLEREKDPDAPAFQSVILAGVTDVRHLRSKIRDEDQHKVNSPWNIAAPFSVEMGFSPGEIAQMLADYEADHGTGMEVDAIARQIFDYTHGYPFLASRVCQIVDEGLVGHGFEDLAAAWTEFGVDEAVRRLLSETNTLFDSLMGKLQNYPELRSKLRALLMRGEQVAYVSYDNEQQQLLMYGFVRVEHNKLVIANRVFEMLLYVFFVGESEADPGLRIAAGADRSAFVAEDGGLDVPKIMAHFIREHNRIHGESGERFLEEEGRERFLTYLSPIINGTGTYSMEGQTRDQRRMDVVIHWLGRRYVIELKIWRGERYHVEGERQIAGYLDYFGLRVGYLLSFDFRGTKRPGVERIAFGDAVLFEGTV